MKYKRLLTLVLAAALCIVAAACGTKNNAPGTDTPTKTDTPTAAPGGTQTVGDTGNGTVREDGSYVPGQVNRLRPVSYTHLDVYKRQGMEWYQ